jgi:hypothetical protein
MLSHLLNVSLVSLRSIVPHPDKRLGASADGGHRVRMHPRQHRNPAPASVLANFSQLVITENNK